MQDKDGKLLNPGAMKKSPTRKEDANNETKRETNVLRNPRNNVAEQKPHVLEFGIISSFVFKNTKYCSLWNLSSIVSVKSEFSVKKSFCEPIPELFLHESWIQQLS